MANLIEDIYNSTTEIDPAIEKITSQQFSSFYSQFKDFDVISKFLSYRTTNQLNFLKQFDSTSKIFPVILRYNLGLPKLVNIQRIAASKQPVYKYITKRGSKSLFNAIAKEQGLDNLEQLILTSVNPVTIRGSETKSKYGSQILNLNISDVDLIQQEDLPQKLPIYSSQQDVNLHAHYKFNIIIKGLLFDQSEILNDVDLNSGLTLNELILTYLTLNQVVHNNIKDHSIKYYTMYDILIPTDVVDFKKYLQLKYSDFSKLKPSTQWQVIKSIMNDYPKYKSTFRVSTGNSDLDDLMNSDFKKNHFITDLNLWIYSKYNVRRVYKTPIEHSALDDFNDAYYKNFYYQIKSTLRYLQRTQVNATLYGNLLTYLSENTLHDVLLSDFANIQETIVSMLRKYFTIESVENYELSIFHYNSFATNFIDYYPMNVVLVQPSYTIRHSSAIICTSTIAKYSNIKQYFDHSNILLTSKHHMTTVSKQRSNFKYLYSSIANIASSVKWNVELTLNLNIAQNAVFDSTINIKHILLRKLYFDSNIVFEHSAIETTTTFVNYKQYIRLKQQSWEALQTINATSEIELVTNSQVKRPVDTILEFSYSSTGETLGLEYSEILLQHRDHLSILKHFNTTIQMVSEYHIAALLDVNSYLELVFKNKLLTSKPKTTIELIYSSKATVFSNSTITFEYSSASAMFVDSTITFEYSNEATMFANSTIVFDYSNETTVFADSTITFEYSKETTVFPKTTIELIYSNKATMFADSMITFEYSNKATMFAESTIIFEYSRESLVFPKTTITFEYSKETTVFPKSTINITNVMVKLLPLESYVELDYNNTHVAYEYLIDDSINLISERTLSGDLTLLRDSTIDFENTWETTTTAIVDSTIDLENTYEATTTTMKNSIIDLVTTWGTTTTTVVDSTVEFKHSEEEKQ